MILVKTSGVTGIALSDFSKAFSPKCLILDEILTSNNYGDGFDRVLRSLHFGNIGLCSFGRKRPKFEYIIGCIGTKFSGYANSNSHRNSARLWGSPSMKKVLCLNVVQRDLVARLASVPRAKQHSWLLRTGSGTQFSC